MKYLYLVLLAAATSCIAATPAEDQIWDALRQGGYTILMRHALAPGNGDPDNFDVNACSTQRNLSDEGRDQARRTGQQFRENGIDQLVVYSSQWCRCLETARLLNLGNVKATPALNSFYDYPSQRDEKTQSATALITALSSSLKDTAQTAIFVTHQVNIAALTGVYPRSGEMVIVKLSDGELVVAGRIAQSKP